MSTPVEQQRSDSALSSLAILKVNFDDGEDYIGNFIPFVAEAIRASAPKAISLPDLQRELERRFGLKIPQGALGTILRRASRKGLIRASHGTYSPNFEALNDSGFAELRRATDERQERLVAQLVAFASETYGVEWDAAAAQNALLGYVDGRSSDLLSRAPRKQVDAKAKGHADVIVAGFVERLQVHDTDSFEFFLNVVKGTMLSNVLYLPGGFGDVEKKFGRTSFYLDTGFVLRAAGFSSKAASGACHELVELLHDLDAPLKIFRHTLDEIQGALDSAIAVLRSGGEIAGRNQFLVDDGWTASDVEQFSNRLTQKLEDLRMEVVDTPPHTARIGLDEKALQARLSKAMANLSSPGVRRDVDSLSAIHRLRSGECRPKLEEADAVFVTTNGTLVYTATDFMRSHHLQGENGVPWCVHAHDLTTLAWLKQPATAPDLPRLQVIADCYAALNPSEELWERYRTEIERLRDKGDISPDDFYLLRYSGEARRTLMLKTQGDPEVFTEGTITDVLERALANARAEAERQLADERQAREAEAVAAAEQLAEARQVSREQVEAAERKAAEAQRQATDATGEIVALKDQLAEDRRQREAHLDNVAHRVARLVSGALLVLVVALIVLAVGKNVPVVGDLTDGIPQLAQVGGYLVVIFGLAGLINGSSANSLRPYIERLVQPRVRKLLGQPPDGTEPPEPS